MAAKIGMGLKLFYQNTDGNASASGYGKWMQELVGALECHHVRERSPERPQGQPNEHQQQQTSDGDEEDRRQHGNDRKEGRRHQTTHDDDYLQSLPPRHSDEYYWYLVDVVKEYQRTAPSNADNWAGYCWHRCYSNYLDPALRRFQDLEFFIDNEELHHWYRQLQKRDKVKGQRWGPPEWDSHENDEHRNGEESAEEEEPAPRLRSESPEAKKEEPQSTQDTITEQESLTPEELLSEAQSPTTVVMHRMTAARRLLDMRNSNRI